ncbi:RNA-binding domain-containing protein [Aspergillus heteromorphus CBS 117.55]|uniref:RNA-binding domain-containing protein n=1 Tax=Aspergillus heteromorphus CBS 117.55 TaxID=1448321 RepID=A0A317WXV0_9EURO|nr:RNA-binding domain-containing protein [Aspergillus heteromorphus CBS 117.55]PWY90731.1 RNA-binding domain-containing protein [Aspergillus heteromorphus CBS 117.55]
MATEYDNENGRYDDEPRFARDRSASPRDEPRADRTRSRSPNVRMEDRAPPIDPRKQLDDDEEGALNTGSNLFVTGIHPRLTESDIMRLFEKYGDVENCSIMLDPHSKESRGFGFVKMVTSDQADAAKEGLQGEVIEGRTLSIEKARRSRPRTPTPGKYFGPPKHFRGGHRGGGRGGDRYDDRRGGYGGSWRRGDDYRYGRYDSYSDRRDYGGRDYRDYGGRRDYRDDYSSYRGGGGGGIDRYASGGGREDRYSRDDRRDDRRDERRGTGASGGGGYYDRDANAASYGGSSAAPARDAYAGGGGSSGGGGGRSYEPRGDDRYSSR